MSVSLQIDNENQQLKVTWDDGHVSPFKYSWLNNHSFTEEAAEKQDNLLFRKPTLWGKELQDKYPTADFGKVNIFKINLLTEILVIALQPCQISQPSFSAIIVVQGAAVLKVKCAMENFQR